MSENRTIEVTHNKQPGSGEPPKRVTVSLHGPETVRTLLRVLIMAERERVNIRGGEEVRELIEALRERLTDAVVPDAAVRVGDFVGRDEYDMDTSKLGTRWAEVATVTENENWGLVITTDQRDDPHAVGVYNKHRPMGQPA